MEIIFNTLCLESCRITEKVVGKEALQEKLPKGRDGEVAWYAYLEGGFGKGDHVLL